MAVIGTRPKLRVKIENNRIVFLDNDAFLRVAGKFSKKPFTIILDDESYRPIEKDLYAFYFGIVIRKECMESEVFKTYHDEWDIHEMLQQKLRSYIRIENKKPVRKTDDVLEYDSKSFAIYVQDVTMYLETTFQIIIKDYEQYSIDKQRLTR